MEDCHLIVILCLVAGFSEAMIGMSAMKEIDKQIYACRSLVSASCLKLRMELFAGIALFVTIHLVFLAITT